MTSKKQIIDEIFELCDSILEKSDKNESNLEQLLEKYPLNETIHSFKLIPVSQFEDQSRQSLKQLSMEQLLFLQEEAQNVLDQVMQEELQINKLELRLTKKPLKLKNYECWDFLLQWPKSNNIENIIMNVKSVTNNIKAQAQQFENGDNDDLNIKYEKALQKIEQLEQQLQTQEFKPILKPYNGQIDKEDLMVQLEQKLNALEEEKEQMKFNSLDSFAKLLQTNS